MSGRAIEWVMQPDEEQPDRPAMCAEKRLFFIRLAWDAWPTPGKGELITDEIHKLAKRAGISTRAAREYVRELEEDGALLDSGRCGYHNTVTQWLVTCRWKEGAKERRARADAEKSEKKGRKRSAKNDKQTGLNGARGDTYQNAREGTPKANQGSTKHALIGARGDIRMMRAATLIGARGDTLYIEQELPSKPDKKSAHCRAASCKTAFRDPVRERGDVPEMFDQPKGAIMPNEPGKPDREDRGRDDDDAWRVAVHKRRELLIATFARRRTLPASNEGLKSLNARMYWLAWRGATPGMIDIAVDRAVEEGRCAGKRVTLEVVLNAATDLVNERPDELAPVVRHVATKEAVSHD